MEEMRIQFKNMDNQFETVGEFKAFRVRTPDGTEFEFSWDSFLKGVIVSTISKENKSIGVNRLEPRMSRLQPNIVIMRGRR